MAQHELERRCLEGHALRDAHVAQLKGARQHRLWRNHLLVYAILNQKAAKYSDGCCAAVYPLGDSECVRALKQYRNLLLPHRERTQLDWPLETIAELWAPAMEANAEHEWFDAFQTRYLRLEESEEAWLESSKNPF